MSWNTEKLGDVAVAIQPGPFGSQLHRADYSETGIPIIMPKDMIGGHIDHTNLSFVSEEHAKRLSRHQVHTGDLIVARKGDVRKCVYISENENGWMTGSDCLKVSLDNSKCVSRFIYYQLRTPFIGRWLETISIGSTMPSINSGLLSSIEIHLPTIEIQKRITKILKCYDDLIDNNNRQIKLLEEAAQRLYKEWFVDLHFPGYEDCKIVDGVPEGWNIFTLGDLCKLRKLTLKSEDIPENTPYIGLEHIPRNDFCLSKWGMAADVNSNKLRYYKNDIIFGKIRPYFHKVGFAINNGVTSTDTFIICPSEGIWGLILMLVSSNAFVDFSYKTCKEGAKMPRADWNQMKNYKTLVADTQIQTLFERYIETITCRIRTLSIENNQIAEARDRLLPKLMSSEIEV